MKLSAPKLSYLALSIGVAVCATSASASFDKVGTIKSTATDNVVAAMVQAHNDKGEYLIVLADKAALDHSYRAKGQKYQAVAETIRETQVELQNQIWALDGNAKVLARTSLLSNSMIVAMSAAKVDALRANGLVDSVIQLRGLDDAEFAKLRAQDSQLTNEEEEDVKDYSGVEGVKVGIVSTGLDFTHAAIGGAGTIEAYADAMAMGPIDFTPTETVFGGIDLQSENGGLDYNPIESNVEYIDEWSGAEFPTGKGTQLASLILQQAPDAKLFPIKIYNIKYDAEQDYTDARWPWRKISEALEYVVDPNGDGDISDRLDVALIDALTTAEEGNYWFFGTDDKTTNAPAMQQYYNNILSNAGAWGTLIVTDAGMDMLPDDEKAGGNEYVYNLAGAGAVASALTVGSAWMDGETTRVTDFTRIGPVRWSETQKPDLVAPSHELEVAMVGTASGMGSRTDSAAAAAVMAGKAAQLMAERPELSSQEVKALLVNTADHNVMKLASDEMEDITRAGAGMANMEAAANSNIVAWERDSYQPWLSFGYVEGQEQFKLVKEISVRNLSDEEQTYQVAVAHHKENPGLTWQHPDSVTVPAGHTVSFPVELSVEPSMLPPWPIRLAEDHTIENYYAAAYTGFVSLTQGEDTPQVDIGWRVLPRSKNGIVKDHFSYKEHYYSQWNPDAGWAPIEAVLGQNYWGQRQQFVNEGHETRTFAAYPGIVLQSDNNRSVNSQDTNGVMISAVGGGIFDDLSQTCESGKKLTIAATFETPLDIAVAYHPDKPSIGYDVLGMSVLTEDFVVANGLDENHHTGYYPQDTDIAMNLWVGMDDNHQPVAWYTDYNKTYDWANPTGRNTRSSLGVTLSAHGTNLVAEWCLDDLYHSKEGYDADWNPITVTYDSPESFDASFGWMFATDRDTAPATNNGNPMPLFNPTIYGHSSEFEFQDWFGNTHLVPIDGTFALSMNKMNEDGSDTELSHMITLAPGEAAYVNAFWKENEVGARLDHKMVLISMDDNFNLNSSVLLDSDSDGIDPSIRAGQVFNVAENSENGTELGRIKLDSEAFFASWSEQYPADIVVLNSVPGAPIAVSHDGYVTVANSDALDYENLQEFELEVGVMDGNRINASGMVKVVVANVDDTPPAYGETEFGVLGDVVVEEGTDVNVNLADYFTDADGSVLSYSVEGLPEGMSFDATTGVISGAPTVAGDYTVVVTASDGSQSTSAEFSFSVSAAPEVEQPESGGSSSSGTGTPLVLSLLSLLALARRRKQ